MGDGFNMVIKIPEALLTYVAQRQTDFQTAWNIFQYVFPIISFETFAMVLCGKFGIIGIPAIIIYIVLPIIGLVILVLIGQLLIRSDYQYLVMKKSMDINKDWKEILERLRRIDNKLK
jgi:hypothetical protein